MAELNKEQRKEAFRKTLRAMPGYPWLPCPICTREGFSSEGCDHTVPERAEASGISFGNETRQ